MTPEILAHPTVVYVSIGITIVTLLWKNIDALRGIVKTIFGFNVNLKTTTIINETDLVGAKRSLYETRLGMALSEMEGLRKQYRFVLKQLAETQQELLESKIKISSMEYELERSKREIQNLSKDKNADDNR